NTNSAPASVSTPVHRPMSPPPANRQATTDSATCRRRSRRARQRTPANNGAKTNNHTAITSSINQGLHRFRSQGVQQGRNETKDDAEGGRQYRRPDQGAGQALGLPLFLAFEKGRPDDGE